MSAFADRAIDVGIGLVIVASFIPLGLNQIANVTLVAGVDPIIETVLTVVVPLMAIVAVLYALYR